MSDINNVKQIEIQLSIGEPITVGVNKIKYMQLQPVSEVLEMVSTNTGLGTNCHSMKTSGNVILLLEIKELESTTIERFLADKSICYITIEDGEGERYIFSVPENGTFDEGNIYEHVLVGDYYLGIFIGKEEIDYENFIDFFYWEDSWRAGNEDIYG